MARPLDGIRVLDFTWAQQGPYATVLLSDMGAEIIKVEGREGERGRAGGLSTPQPVPYFVAHDRGKRSITLDVRTAEGRTIALELARRVDVVVSNMRPGVMERLGLGYEDVRAVNPRIVYACASAFGPLGEQATRPGLDIVGQAMGGIMSVTGPEGAPPMPAGAAIADQVGAIFLCTGILAALVKRERTGEGEQVDVSLYGSQIALQSWEIDTASMLGTLSGRAGQGHPLITPRGVWRSFETADGALVVGGVNAVRFKRLCTLSGLDELAQRYPDDASRAAGVNEIIAAFERRFVQEPTAYWLERFVAHDIIGAPVQSYADVLADPQAWVNGYVVELPHATLGTVRVAGSPIQFGRKPTEPQGPAPELGDHTEHYLRELGYDWEAIGKLRDAKVI
ncbi:MAG TPA: CoA transferase [Dehalococcoidia bacterium]|nr:CoA transferase [Dehalococcoidia bacterium]